MIYDEENTLCVTCASGIEKVTKKELERLGYGETPAVNGVLTFKGNGFDVARCNVNLRTADRVYIKICEFPVTTFDELFDGVKSVKWKNYFPSDAKVIVNGKCVKSKIFAISACQSIIKKAVAENLCEAYHKNRISEFGAEYSLKFSIYKDVFTLLLDTSGAGLNKRGYRDLVGIAPIKETLAASLVLLSDYYYKRPFLDPFCGSGTIAIEAAMIAQNIAPGKLRKFAFNEWNNFNEKYFRKAIEEANDKEKREKSSEILGSDIDKKAIKLALRHAERAGVKDYVNFSVSAVKDVKISLKCGTIVTNPPYGTRVYDKEQAEECYKDLGNLYRSLDGWSAFVITSDNAFQKRFGLKADRIRKLYNSDLECNYYYYYGKKEKEND